MKTTSLGAKLTRLHSGIGNAIMSLAMARGLDKAVAELASPTDGPRRRSRTPGPARSPGAKLRRAAHNGTITVRHVSSTDQYWRDVYAKRLMAKRLHFAAVIHFGMAALHVQCPTERDRHLSGKWK